MATPTDGGQGGEKRQEALPKPQRHEGMTFFTTET